MSTFDAEHPPQPLERAVGGPILTAPLDAARIEAPWSGATAQSALLHVHETLKVRTSSRPSAVAGAIAGVMRGHGEVDVQAIGAGATNQAIKAIAIARTYLLDDGIDVCVVPSFIDLVIDGEERTGLRLFVQQRPH